MIFIMFIFIYYSNKIMENIIRNASYIDIKYYISVNFK